SRNAAGASRSGRDRVGSRPRLARGLDVGEARRALDAGAAQPAIAPRVLCEILLMIVLGVVELGRFHDLRRDRAITRRAQQALVRVGGAECGTALLVSVVVDAGAILRADVIALPHALGGIVILPEDAKQVLVADHDGVEDCANALGVAGEPATDLLVRRVR